jgi:hypothetical protein
VVEPGTHGPWLGASAPARKAKAAGGIAMLNPFALEMEAMYRQEAALGRAARERLFAMAQRARPRGRRGHQVHLLHRTLIHWAGAQLVQWGYRLLELPPPPSPRFQPVPQHHGAGGGADRDGRYPTTLRLRRGYW